MEESKIINEVLNMDITQVQIAEYLGITRQTVAKIKSGKYSQLSHDVKLKIKYLDGRKKSDVLKILSIVNHFKKIQDTILNSLDEDIDAANEGIEYMSYWFEDEKFKGNRKYHRFYYGHMNNFMPRYNQAALFMRDTLNRQKYPLVTYQLNYETKMIVQMKIKEFKKEYYMNSYDTTKIQFPISFNEFLLELNKRIYPRCRFLIYSDYEDDDWKFILENSKKSIVHDFEIYDLSRLFNFFENEQPYYGPLIEDVLDQFNVKYNDNLLKDASYRADIIVSLINMISLEDLHMKKHDKTSYLFDSHGLKRDNSYKQKERRKKKEN